MDYIIRASAAGGDIRAFASVTTELTETARKAHNTSPVATAALGRLLTAAGMMGVMMKGEQDILTIKIQGDGPMEGLTVTADSKGDVKGYVYQPEVMLPPSAAGKLDVGGAIGKGVLSVVQDIGLKEPYVGQTDLVSGEIAEDLTYYYAVSEQVPSSVALGVLMNRNNTVRQAGGFIIQLMPGASEESICRLEEKLKTVSSVTSMLEAGMMPEDILNQLLGDQDLEILDRMETQFYCGCSRSRVERALISTGKKELEDMIQDGKPVTVNCQFCENSYVFSVEDLQSLLQRAGG